MTIRGKQTQHEKDLGQMLKHCGVENPRGMEMFRLLGIPTHLLEALIEQELQASGLSFPRLRLLIWLQVEELRGNTQGVSPSRLSKLQPA